MQAGCDETAAFFDKHGFALLKAPTQVKDWNQDYSNKNSDITNFYHGEIEDLVRKQLFPAGTDLQVCQEHGVLRRGPQSDNNFYASGIHQDYALTWEQYNEAGAAYGGGNDEKMDKLYEENDVAMVICFWRPINMEGKLINNPLTVLDCSSVQKEEIVKTELYGFTPTGKPQPQLSLKQGEQQRWCYYPDMTCDEVLAFKQFYVRKSDPDGEYKCCFHTAFVDPRERFFSR